MTDTLQFLIQPTIASFALGLLLGAFLVLLFVPRPPEGDGTISMKRGDRP